MCDDYFYCKIIELEEATNCTKQCLQGNLVEHVLLCIAEKGDSNERIDFNVWFGSVSKSSMIHSRIQWKDFK